EQYPDLKANTNFINLQQELSAIEGDIEKSRRYYNGTARDNNIAIESFPSNIVANMFQFNKVEFFELSNESEREVPKVKF
ncbi:MAG: LemA family protein, partial [Bacteroidia bacterium]|nr:LemA family protein [Bacteroidia bacterium]